jgi:hypothetical protein
MGAIRRDLGAEACRALPPGGRFRLRVSGRSMEPVLLDGDEIEAERVALGDVRLGDLVVVELPGTGLVVHRLLWRGWRKSASLRTRGDGSRRMDPPVPPAGLLGRVLAATRGALDVTPGPFARRLQWGRHFSAAALHRLRRRLGRTTTRSRQR